MPENTSTYEPMVLVDTADLPEDEWLEWRRRGIGGSDAAAILGVSPFATARDLYYDKLKVVSYEDGESNWVQKKVGHLLEDLVAEIFHVKTGFEIYQVKKMFYHPVYTYMLADVDYFIRLPNGKTAILEIKTTNYNAKDHWWCDGCEIVPVNYEIQGRHYMCVMNVDEVYYCCLYYDEHPVLYYLTPDDDYKIELYAGLVVKRDSVIYSPNPRKSEFAEFLTYAKEHSTFQSDVEITEDDTLITLSTCSYEYNNARYIVMGKLLLL